MSQNEKHIEDVKDGLKVREIKQDEQFQLPEPFANRMQSLLQDEWDEFFQSYNAPRAYGIRYNPLKFSSREEFLEKIPFEVTPVPWCEEGFYCDAEEKPGRHPWHEGGAYYIQEPSAMSAVELLDVKPGQVVCDLCAAPGGKTTQIAGKMMGEGLLVANEYYAGRAKILSQNVERMGVKNAVVLNEDTKHLSEHFPVFFDRILVDAPCSGEGMFRKDKDAMEEWSEDNVRMCAERQREILEHAATMLKPGGIMVYSTCTFAPEENEQTICHFLERHPEFSIKKWEKDYFSPARPEWAVGAVDEFQHGFQHDIQHDIQHGFQHDIQHGYQHDLHDDADRTCQENLKNEHIKDTYRLWPHKLGGEGHYVARLVKAGGMDCGNIQQSGAYTEETLNTGMHGTQIQSVEIQNTHSTQKKKNKKRSVKGSVKGSQKGSAKGNSKNGLSAKESLKDYEAFEQACLCQPLLQTRDGEFIYFGDQLYLIPKEMCSLTGLKVERAGLHVGTRKKNRFEPSHALAMSIGIENVKSVVECTEPIRYLHGETIPCENQKGWVLVVNDGVPLGWGKAQNGIVKNHYPKGLRICY